MEGIRNCGQAVMLREDARGSEGEPERSTPTRSRLRHHLPQLLEEVLNEDEALWLHIIVLRSRGADVLRRDQPVAVGMQVIGDPSSPWKNSYPQRR